MKSSCTPVGLLLWSFGQTLSCIWTLTRRRKNTSYSLLPFYVIKFDGWEMSCSSVMRVELLQLPRSINHSYFTHKSAWDSLILLLEHKHKWLPPPNGWLKFNFYASVHDNGVYRASVYRDSSGTYDMLGVFDSLGYGWRATTIWYITIDALERAWFQGHIWAWIRCLNSNHLYVHGFKDPCGHGHNSQLLKLNPTRAYIFKQCYTINIFLLEENFNKFIVKLYYFYIFLMFEKF